MLIKDQIKFRREQLKMSVPDVARKLGVSAQAVRHWEAGRSDPSKELARQLEVILSMSLDWSEGARTSGERTTADALIQQQDIDLLLIICRLPYGFKQLLGQLAQEHLKLAGQTVRADPPASVPAFSERRNEARGQQSPTAPTAGAPAARGRKAGA